MIAQRKIWSDSDFCFLCGTTNDLVLHHTCYAPEEMISVCRRCHGRIHKSKEFDIALYSLKPRGLLRQTKIEIERAWKEAEIKEYIEQRARAEQEESRRITKKYYEEKKLEAMLRLRTIEHIAQIRRYEIPADIDGVRYYDEIKKDLDYPEEFQVDRLGIPIAQGLSKVSREWRLRKPQ